MDPSLHRVSISGSTLAHLLQDFSASCGDCDGILFGRVHTEVLSRLEDDDEQCGLREEVHAVLTGFCSSGSSLSFYDGCGMPDPGKLSKLSGHTEGMKGPGNHKEEEGYRESERHRKGRDPMIGWFLGRRNTPLRPSLREMAVTKGLVFSRIHNHGGSNTVGVSHDASVSSLNSKESPMSSPRPNVGDVSSPIDVDSSPSDGGNRTNQRITGARSKDRDVGTSLPPSDFPALSFQPKENMENTSELSPNKTMGKKTLSNDAVLDPSSVQLKGVVENQPSSPFLFMLLTESGTDQAVHTHDYRVYQYHIRSQRFEPKMLKIVNIGPAFRGNYDSFSPAVPFPLFPVPRYSADEGQSDLHNKTMLKAHSKEEHDGNIKGLMSVSNEQELLNVYAEGYKVEKLEGILGLHGTLQVPALEDLYSKMLLKLKVLAKQVSDSSSVLVKQETYVAQLRNDVMEI